MSSQHFEMISVEEYARRMSVSRSTVFDWLAKGYLEEGQVYVRVGKTIRFFWSRESLAALANKPTSHGNETIECPDLPKGRKGPQVNLDY
jgi:excisionase family DNA binding protein